MADIITQDRATFGVKTTLEAAQKHARMFVASGVRLVRLYAQTLGYSEDDDPPRDSPPIGYVAVASDHECPCCGQHVSKEAWESQGDRR